MVQSWCLVWSMVGSVVERVWEGEGDLERRWSPDELHVDTMIVTDWHMVDSEWHTVASKQVESWD